jgi:RNAse (barnase) inhibitor barstar
MAEPRNPFLTTSAPWIVLADLADAKIVTWLAEASKAGVAVQIDGEIAVTQELLFVAFADALQFPDYFGANWSALQDCLTDLEWLPSELYVITVINAGQLLSECVSKRKTLLETILAVGEEWAAPVELGEWWDRPARPFHLVLDSSAESWSTALLKEISGSL